jgi:hypothetical protein
MQSNFTGISQFSSSICFLSFCSIIVFMQLVVI